MKLQTLFPGMSSKRTLTRMNSLFQLRTRNKSNQISWEVGCSSSGFCTNVCFFLRLLTTVSAIIVIDFVTPLWCLNSSDQQKLFCLADLKNSVQHSHQIKREDLHELLLCQVSIVGTNPCGHLDTTPSENRCFTLISIHRTPCEQHLGSLHYCSSLLHNDLFDLSNCEWTGLKCISILFN